MKYLSILILLIFSISNQADIKTESLLIYGDSISAGYGMSKEKQWSVLLQEKIIPTGIRTSRTSKRSLRSCRVDESN